MVILVDRGDTMAAVVQVTKEILMAVMEVTEILDKVVFLIQEVRGVLMVIGAMEDVEETITTVPVAVAMELLGDWGSG